MQSLEFSVAKKSALTDITTSTVLLSVAVSLAYSSKITSEQAGVAGASL